MIIFKTASRVKSASFFSGLITGVKYGKYRVSTAHLSKVFMRSANLSMVRTKIIDIEDFGIPDGNDFILVLSNLYRDIWKYIDSLLGMHYEVSKYDKYIYVFDYYDRVWYMRGAPNITVRRDIGYIDISYPDGGWSFILNIFKNKTDKKMFDRYVSNFKTYYNKYNLLIIDTNYYSMVNYYQGIYNRDGIIPKSRVGGKSVNREAKSGTIIGDEEGYTSFI